MLVDLFGDTGAVHSDAETMTCPFAEQSDGHFAPPFDENMGISICSSAYVYNSGINCYSAVLKECRFVKDVTCVT